MCAKEEYILPQIRRAELPDTKFLRDNNIALALETEDIHLDTRTVEHGVRGLLQNPERGFYCLAEMKSKPAGSLMITPEWSDWHNGIFWWIQSVYVLPEFRRQGIYTALYRYVMNLASNNSDVCGLRLYVEKENEVAQASYVTLGMHKSDYLLYEVDLPVS